MGKTFRVLVVDDKKAVLDAMKDWIDYNIQVAEESFNVELLLLHAQVIENNGKHHISPKTLENLYEYCDKPFNLILADFGFVEQGVNTIHEIKKLQQLYPNKTVRELLDKIILNPSHLTDEAIYLNKQYKKVKKQFINFNGNLYVYTYIPNDIERDYTSADVRKNITNKHFPDANIYY